MPGTWKAIWQVTKSPRRQESQRPQCPPCQPTPTRWPDVHPATPAPTASMIPAISCPGTRGYLMPGCVPSFVKESLWQTPQASTLMRTNPAPGSGISRSTIASGPFILVICATRIFDMVSPILRSQFVCSGYATFETHMIGWALSPDHAVRVEDEFLGGAFVKVLVALRRSIEWDDCDVDGLGDLYFVMEDRHHELPVIFHGG